MMDGDSDTNILALDFPKPGIGSDREWQVAVNAMIAAHRTHQKTAIVLSNLGELLPEDVRERLIASGIAPMQGLQEGLAALAALVHYGKRRDAVTAMENPERLLLQNAQLHEGEAQLLDEWESKLQVGAYGVPVPCGRTEQRCGLIEAAEMIGFPVVVKAISRHLAHKTEAGAVALNLQSSDDVAKAADDMVENLATRGLADCRFLIEPMISDAVGELIVGLKRDEQFGLVLVVGTGGILVNLINDSVTLLLPTDRDTVSDALLSLKGARLLTGYRGVRKEILKRQSMQ